MAADSVAMPLPFDPEEMAALVQFVRGEVRRNTRRDQGWPEDPWENWLPMPRSRPTETVQGAPWL